MYKPLKGKAYGSIPHLPDSRRGPGDHGIQIEQALICTHKSRDKHDNIIVQEKLDGSNCCVANINGEILAITRAGYLAKSSKYEQHHMFDKWVENNILRFKHTLKPGERMCGEWLAQAHGTIYYNIGSQWDPFCVFDIFDTNNRRLINSELNSRLASCNFDRPYIISTSCITPYNAIAKLDDLNNKKSELMHNCCSCEGVVYRVERNNRVDFLCKYVKHDKIDGKYFPQYNNNKITWNYLI